MTSASTMGQRLSRAKAKIRDAGIAFEVPSGAELAPRLFAVLEAIYAAYAFGWDDVAGADNRGLADEALWLARTLVELMPQEPEALGLLALLCYCQARRSERRAADGSYVPMSEQDSAHWDGALLSEGDRWLSMAATRNQLGRFQLEAAVQSAHVERLRGGPVSWDEIVALYDGLIAIAPTLGARLGKIAAAAEANGPARALELLERLPADDVQQHQPYWAVRAHLLQSNGDVAGADGALEKALELTQDPVVRAFLQRSRQRRA